jgi:rubrerythrin
MNYQKPDDHVHKHDYCHMDDDCKDHEMPHMKESGYSDMCSDMSQMKCKVEKECVKTYKSYYKLYKICHYRLYKICPCCGHEFDYHQHRGICPRCGANI